MSINSNIDDECLKIFEEIKFNKKYRSIVYKVENERVVLIPFIKMIETTGDKEQNWGSFIASLPKAEPRLCVFDLEYTSHDGMKCSKLFFFYWLPDGTPLKMKFPYATMKESFKTKIDLLGKEIVATTPDDVPQIISSTLRPNLSRSLINDSSCHNIQNYQ